MLRFKDDFMAMQFMCDYNIKYDDERKNEKERKKVFGKLPKLERASKRVSVENERTKERKTIWELAPKTGRLTFHIFLLLPSSSFGSLNSRQT